MMDSADHQLSRVTGFLPEQEPLSRLPDYYVIWEETLDNLNSLIKSKKLRVTWTDGSCCNYLPRHSPVNAIGSEHMWSSHSSVRHTYGCTA